MEKVLSDADFCCTLRPVEIFALMQLPSITVTVFASILQFRRRLLHVKSLFDSCRRMELVFQLILVFLLTALLWFSRQVFAHVRQCYHVAAQFSGPAFKFPGRNSSDSFAVDVSMQAATCTL